MSIFRKFFSKKQNSAQIARDRLQIVVSHHRSRNKRPNFLPKLQQELIQVIAKYVKIEKDQVNVVLDNDGKRLELNVTLPETV